MTRRALLALAASAFAAERKNRVPVSHEPLNVKLPQATPVQLSNGLTLIAMEDSRLPLAWVRFQVDGAGSLYEPHKGLANITASMLVEGSKHRSGQQIAQEAARLGATLDAGLDPRRETATVDASGLSARFYDWLALTADLLQNPTFAVDEFNGRRERRGVNLRMDAARPDDVANESLNRVIYGSHPAGAGSPTAEDLAALTPEMAASWHRERYAPANTVLTVIGRVRTSAVSSAAEKLLSGWKTPAPRFSLPPEPQPQAHRRILVIDRPGAAQTRLAIGNLLFPRGSPDYDATTIANRVLGAGGNSRVEQLEASGQVLTARSTMATARFTGNWQIRATMRTEATAAALTSIFAELRRLCEEPVPSQELEEAKSAAIGRFALTLEQPSDVINYSYTRYRYGFSADYWEHSPARTGALTAAEIQAVARKYYQPEQAHIVAVGDASKIREALSKFGKVES
jgi:zinc protease